MCIWKCSLFKRLFISPQKVDAATNCHRKTSDAKRTSNHKFCVVASSCSQWQARQVISFPIASGSCRPVMKWTPLEHYTVIDCGWAGACKGLLMPRANSLIWILCGAKSLILDYVTSPQKLPFNAIFFFFLIWCPPLPFLWEHSGNIGFGAAPHDQLRVSRRNFSSDTVTNTIWWCWGSHSTLNTGAYNTQSDVIGGLAVPLSPGPTMS